MEATIAIKERPILFSGPMVRALLAGTKTQTRRAVKPGAGQQWLGDKLALSPAARICKANYGGKFKFGAQFEHPISGPLTHVLCPYGQPGDRLWVRETLSETPCGSYLYAADSEHVLEAAYEHSILRKEKKAIPAIHMPRAASRLLLEITAVRVERVQDISEADAVAEGIEKVDEAFGKPTYRDYLHKNVEFGYPQGSFESLWTSINGADSWPMNPWVWVVEFKIVSPIQN